MSEVPLQPSGWLTAPVGHLSGWTFWDISKLPIWVKFDFFWQQVDVFGSKVDVVGAKLTCCDLLVLQPATPPPPSCAPPTTD